jgi:hypothetical protein
MYAPISLQNAGVELVGRENAILPEARKLFNRALRLANLKRAKVLFTRHPRRLLALADLQTQVVNRAYAGVMTVALDDIRGTLDKADSFDADFRPLREDMMTRWAGVAGAVLRGVPLPPVELVEVDGVYYVMDGHHRISVAGAMGQAAIEAVVTRWKIA